MKLLPFTLLSDLHPILIDRDRIVALYPAGDGVQVELDNGNSYAVVGTLDKIREFVSP